MSKDPENNIPGNEPNNFGLPEGYFQKSAGSILNKIEWIEEHKAFPRLNEFKKENGFTVPANYFESSEAKLELIAYPKLSLQPKDTGHIVPDSFFEECEVNELAKVFRDEENEIEQFAFLNAITKQNPFIVNETYFSDSEQKIISAIHKPAKVIKLFGAKMWYSAAAAIIALTLGLWIYNNYFKPAASKDCGSLACVDKTDLVKTKHLESLDEDQLYEIVDTKKLENKLEGNEDKKDKTNTDTSLKNVSTEDLLDEI